MKLLPDLKQKIAQIIRSKEFWVLLIILGVGAYLRLFHIGSLATPLEEYDEAVLTLQGRAIASGFVPYRDFLMVHPPFYYLVMAAIYKVCGYSLFYARYLSVLLSLASIVLIYLTGKKLYHTGAALVAATLFAVSPDMVYIGRRATQEALWIFLVVLAIYFISDFILNQRKKAIIFSGLALGAALATKYIVLPAVIAVVLTVIIFLMGEKFRDGLKQLVKPSFLLVWVILTAVFLAVAFFIIWIFTLPLSVPIINENNTSTGGIILICGICGLTLMLTALIRKKKIPFREWLLGLCAVLRKRDIWYLIGSILCGFLVITGYFWIRVPHEFFSQTMMTQGGRGSNFPSFVSLFYWATHAWGYLKIAYITALLSLPVAILMLNKQNVNKADYFIAVAIIITLIFCQFFPGAPRYYYAVYPFFLLGLAGFVPHSAGLISANIKSLAVNIKIKIFGISAVTVIFLLTSLVLIVDLPGYDFGTPRLTYDDQYINQKTIAYLESVTPNKVFSANPIFIALSTRLNHNIDVDTFGILHLKNETAEQLIQDNINRGTDYFVLDYWARNVDHNTQTNTSAGGTTYTELVQAISRHARLVQRIGTYSLNFVEIYELVPDNVRILNGNFSQWAKGEFTMVPAGWQSTLIPVENGNGDSAAIYEDNKDLRQCVRLEVTENGQPDNKRNATYCEMYQSIPFPANALSVDIMPTFNNDTDQKAVISFAGGTHGLTISFSDTVNTEQFVKSADGQTAEIIRPAKLSQWSQETIDLAAYWDKAGWEQPAEIQIKISVWARYTSPDKHELYIAGIREE